MSVQARIRSAAILALTLAALGAGPAQAATIAVNSVSDTPDAVAGDGTCGSAVPNTCTLRAAIQEANANADATNTLTMTGISGTITATSALPNITKALIIDGTGSNGRVALSGGDLFSLLRFVCTTAPCPSGGSYEVKNLVVTNGVAGSGGGGGIYFGAAGTVNFTVTNVDVTSSDSGSSPGGGIAAVLLSNNSTLTLTNARIGTSGNGNSAGGDGGGLWVRFDGSTATMTLENSSVVGNSSDGNGGGVAVARGRLNIFESTISGNTAVSKGGGVYLGKTGSVGGSARIENVTISGNTAASGAGLGANDTNPAASSMTFTTITANTGVGIAVATTPNTTFPGNSVSLPFTSNIVAGNSGDECAAAFSHSDAGNSGYNLTDESSGASTCGFTAANNDQFGTTAQTLGLASLANNPTAPQTHALLAGSKAIDKGNPNWDTGSDQRGAHSQDGLTFGANAPKRDIGAYEFGGYGLVQLSASTYEIGEDTTPVQVLIKRYGTGSAIETAPVVQFSSAEDSATEGTCGDLISTPDYTDANPTTFTFAISGAMQFTQTASFEICYDEEVEGDETFDVALAEPANDTVGYDLGPITQGVVTIHDVENGVFAFDNAAAHAANEGGAGSGGSITLTILRTDGSSGAVRVPYSTTSTCSTPCTATADTDYTSVSGGFVDFGDGQASRTITINFAGDAAFEGNETFEVDLGTPICQGLAAGQDCDARLSGTADDTARVTIGNDDAPSSGLFRFEFDTYSVDETGALTVKVKRVGGSDGAVSVHVEAISGTAQAGSQFNLTSPVDGNLSWAVGDSADKTVTVTPVDDPSVESDKHFTLELSNPQTSTVGVDAPTLGSPSTASVALTSDEKPTFQFTIPGGGGYRVNEANTNITLTVTWTAFTGEDVAVAYFTEDGTAVSPVDYTGIPEASAGNITATGGGATSTTFQVAIKADAAAEGNETFTANLGAPQGGGALGGNDTAPVTIVDPSGARFTSATYTRTDEQSGGAITVTVERFGDISQPFSVDYEIAECATAGCATQGDDYYRLAGTTGTISWNANNNMTPAQQTFTVNVQSDTIIEGDETFDLTLSNPQVGTGPTTTPGALGLAAATGIVPDDDYRFEVVETSPLAVGEAAGNAVVTVRRFGSTIGAASLNFATADDTATAGSDYTSTASPPALSWANGEGGTKTIQVPVTADAVDELNETLTLAMSGASNNVSGEATPITGSPITVSITDDDTSVVSIATAASATEASNVTFTVSLSTPSDRDITVTYNTADGTATSADYTGVANGQVVFSPGETSDSVSITTLADALNEANETFTVGLASATNGATLDGTASNGTGTITDDDPVPTLSVADVTVTEANTTDATMTFVVTLSAASGRTVSVNYVTANGTATAPADYTAVPSTLLTFAPGEVTKSVSVTVKSDALDEVAETLALNLSGATNATIADASATGTINDGADDLPPTLSIADVVVQEGDTTDVVATFTVTLSAASSQTVTVNYATANGTALAPGDYTAANGTLTFAPGVTSRTFTVTVKSDGSNEQAETFTATLTVPTNASIADGSATGTINDGLDDKGGGGGSWSLLSLWLLLPVFVRRRLARA